MEKNSEKEKEKENNEIIVPDREEEKRSWRNPNETRTYTKRKTEPTRQRTRKHVTGNKAIKYIEKKIAVFGMLYVEYAYGLRQDGW